MKISQIKFLAVFLALILLVITGCGGGSSSNTVSISISPTSSTLTPNQTVQFSATVTNAADTSVTWQVNSVTGGSSSTGTISTTGLYTAPSSIGASTFVTITAISVQDTSKTASASVTLNPSNTAPTPPILISPSSASLPAGAQQTFAATVSGAATTVTWSVTCNGQSGSQCGVIDQNGVYTAPLVPPIGGGAMVTATVSDSSALPGNAPVTIQISNQSLFGTYAFSASGRNGSNFAAVAGSVTFDGQGNVTGGVEDGLGASNEAITGGSYHVGTDGRGTLTIKTASSTTNWQLVIANQHALLESFDSGGRVMSGTLDAQNANQFNASAIQGNYSFLLSGASSGNASGSLNAAGAFVADGAGALLQGFLDVNDTGTAQTALALSGSYSAPSAAGRGTLTLTSTFGTQSFVYYVVDGTHLKLLETDASNQAAGDIYQQTASPFAAGSLHGVFVTAMLGADANGSVSTGGIFTLNGAGGVTGTIDVNNNGNVQSSVPVTGTYTVADATTGRTTMSWSTATGTRDFVLYPSATGKLNVLELDTASEAGAAIIQPFSGAFQTRFVGNFAIQAFGTDLVTFSGAEKTFLGHIVPNGGSSISGTISINADGQTEEDASLQASYGFDAAGRSQLNVTSSSNKLDTATLTFYAADGNTAVFIESDSNQVIAGVVERQY